MLKTIISKMLRKNHFWRDVGFDELSELYISNMLRSVALTIFMVFVPFYLYQQGYSAAAIFSIFGCFFIGRLVSDITSAYTAARIGPKHTMIISCLLQIISTSILLTVPSMHWHPVLIALPWGAAASFFFIPYHIEFSKIKHTGRAGHELGHMQAFEKVGFLVGPLIGGLVGSVFGPQYIFLTATVLLVASLWPLFLSAEAVKTKQKLDFGGLPVHKIRRDLFSYAALGIENTLCINVWPLYVAVFLFSGAVYAQLGIVTAAGVLAAIITAKVIGRLTDTGVARPLMWGSAILNAAMYAVRPFVQGVWGVFAVNMLNEALTTAYRMPYTKGMYAAADDLPGYRIVYIATMEAMGSIVKATAWFFLAILALAFSLKTVLFVGFAVAALASLGITHERFKVYNHK